MKKLSKREKILLAVLVVIIIGVCWYKFIYEPVNNQIAQLNNDLNTEQSDLTVLLPKIKQKNEMKKAVEEIKASGSVEKIPVYDNSKELMVALNKVMSKADSYTINFGQAGRDGYIFIHKILISFTTRGYKQARQIIDQLTTETFVNQISDVSFSNSVINREVINKQGETVSRTEEETRVNLTITFFEIDGEGE